MRDSAENCEAQEENIGGIIDDYAAVELAQRRKDERSACKAKNEDGYDKSCECGRCGIEIFHHELDAWRHHGGDEGPVEI